jgi:probable HAF family extracellular repeat protein
MKMFRPSASLCILAVLSVVAALGHTERLSQDEQHDSTDIRYKIVCEGLWNSSKPQSKLRTSTGRRKLLPIPRIESEPRDGPDGIRVVVARNAEGDEIGSKRSADGAKRQGYLWRSGSATNLGSLGGTFTCPCSINVRRQIVGYGGTRGVRARAFLWEDGQIQDLGTLGGKYSSAACVNDAGQVVGKSETSNGDMHAMLCVERTMVDLGTLGGSESSAESINNRGDIVGYSVAGRDFSDQRAVLWHNGRIVDLNCLIPRRPRWALIRADVIDNDGCITVTGWMGGQLRNAILVPTRD